MRKRFYRILHWIHNKLHKQNYILTGRGLYACYYLVEKYFNNNDNGTNAEYEEFVDKTLERIETKHFFQAFRSHFGEQIELTLEEKRGFAAQMAVIAMLYQCKNDDREKVYNYIEDENARNMVKQCIQRGIIL